MGKTDKHSITVSEVGDESECSGLYRIVAPDEKLIGSNW